MKNICSFVSRFSLLYLTLPLKYKKCYWLVDIHLIFIIFIITIYSYWANVRHYFNFLFFILLFLIALVNQLVYPIMMTTSPSLSLDVWKLSGKILAWWSWSTHVTTIYDVCYTIYWSTYLSEPGKCKCNLLPDLEYLYHFVCTWSFLRVFCGKT